MRKLISLFLMVSLVFNFVMASNARMISLGGEPAMLIDDDVSIGLFPQRVNDFNIARIEGLAADQPGYLVIFGDKGDKWGAWGSSPRSQDLFNIYRSWNASSALEISFDVYREAEKIESENSNRERTAGGINTDITYGWDTENSEKAVSLGFSYGPGAILEGDQYGDIDYKDISPLDTNLVSGESYKIGANANYLNRTDCRFPFFEKRYDNVSIRLIDSAVEMSRDGEKTDDEGIFDIYINARTFLFNRRKINDYSKLYYGIGAGAGYYHMKIKSLEEIDEAHNDAYIGILNFVTGLEMNFNNLDLRIGINRNKTLYSSQKMSAINIDDREASLSYIGRSGSYRIVSGLGYNYKNLQVNVVLNNKIWESGPQIFFDSNLGKIFTTLDLVYTF